MLDLRNTKVIDLTESKCLKDEATFQYTDSITNKSLVAKFIAWYQDENDAYLITEFKKLALLSAEPEIATVYFLASGDFGSGVRSCYVMDFIRGETLGDLIRNNKILTYNTVVNLLIQIAQGLEKSHHYEISHGDLHEENILITSFGYVKIIDFLWWDSKLPFIKKAHEDILSFKLIVTNLEEKLNNTDTQTFRIISDCIKHAKTMNGLGKTIELLNKVSIELSIIDNLSKDILGKIINSITTEANLMHVLQELDLDIPDLFIPEITENEKKLMYDEKHGRLKLSYFDSRLEDIDRNLKRKFSLKLHQLKQAGFIDWQIGTVNKGDKFVGPYKLNYQIFFTTKLFEWKRLNEEFNFLPNPSNTLPDLILM